MISNFTKDLEVIDFFTVLLSIHIGGVNGGLFGFSTMLFSRLFGPREWLPFTIKDSVSLFIGGVATPLVYLLTGHNILYTLYAFTIIRYTVYLILTHFFEHDAMRVELGYSLVGLPVGLISNTIMDRLFSSKLDRLLENGLKLDWGVLLFCTAIIAGTILFSRGMAWIEARRQKEESDKAPVATPTSVY